MTLNHFLPKLDYNPILDTDSYKLAHFQGYPDDVDQVHSYAESRGGQYPATLQFGTQSYVQTLAAARVTKDHIEEAQDFAGPHGLPFNRKGWMSIYMDYDGFLPLTIRAADEGLLIPTRNALASVESDPGFNWLSSYVETNYIAHLWPSVTIATRCFYIKQKLIPVFEQTSDSGKVNDFAVLNFGARGSCGVNHVEIGGAAHLSCFLGTDSIMAVRYVNHHYKSPMSGFSVPATEHSVMCSWKADGVETIRALLARMGKRGGVLSIVGDTWNIYEFAKAAASMAQEFKDAGVTFVCRPDSGDMREVISRVLQTLLDGFGWMVNSKGFRVIDGAKLLWGDGIDEDSCVVPFEIARDMGVSADSIMVGSGGGLMQKHLDRDTCRFAFKASAIHRVGAPAWEWEGIAKDPITDSGKKSKIGRQALIRVPKGFQTIPIVSGRVAEQDLPHDDRNLLKVRYRRGELLNLTTIDEVRERVEDALYSPFAYQEHAAAVQAAFHL